MTAVTCESFISKLIVKVTEVTCKVTASTCQSDSFYLPNMECLYCTFNVYYAGQIRKKCQLSNLKFDILLCLFVKVTAVIGQSDSVYLWKWQQLVVKVTISTCLSYSIYLCQQLGQQLLVKVTNVACESDISECDSGYLWKWQKLLVNVIAITCQSKSDSSFLWKGQHILVKVIASTC